MEEWEFLGEVKMNIIDELVSEKADIAEDKSTYKALKAEGINPFKSEKISDIIKASEISDFVLKELTDMVNGCDDF